MQSELVIPEWLHNIFLGYGHPGSAHYTMMPNLPKEIDFRDTFLDYDHLTESFPGMVSPFCKSCYYHLFLPSIHHVYKFVCLENCARRWI